MKNKILSIICLFTINTFAQGANVKSPNVSDFIRYGNIPVKMYTGELDLTIPTLSMPINGQNPIELTLSYNASGFMPNKRPGIVGLNWNINGIGAITREVKGCPDENIGSPSTSGGINGRFEHGFMVGVKYLKDANSPLPNNLLQGEVYPFDCTKMTFMDANDSRQNSFETTPDVFSYNVNGLSGKFFMTSDGKIKVISNSPSIVSVDLTNFNFQPYTVQCSPVNLSEIKLIDDKGNKYYFGGESKYLEYSLNLILGIGKNPVINTWCLKRIEYYNNEVLYYNYQNDTIDGYSSFCDPNGGFYHGGVNQNDQIKKFIFLTEYLNDSRSFSGSNPSGGAGNLYTLHKKAFLDNITNLGNVIKFNYSSQSFVLNNNSNLNINFKNFKEFKLDNLELTNNNQTIKKFNLIYSLKGGTAAVNSYPRLFLDRVNEVGMPPYIFEYNILPNQSLPKPSTAAIDFWSYYNGKLSNDTAAGGTPLLIAQSTIDANSDETFISNIRFSDFEFASIGIIKKVIYPTGGYSSFEYEPHAYAKRLDRKSSSNFLPSLFNVNDIVGGTRIKKITNFDGNQTINIKEYLYKDANNNSTGILMQWPRTRIDYTYQYYRPGFWYNGLYNFEVNNSVNNVTFQSSAINMNSIENAVINYSQVTEKNTNNGKTVYNFKDYNNYPDINDSSTIERLCAQFTPNNLQIIENFIPENLVKNLSRLYNDRSIERGKVESKLVYDQNNILQFKENYQYNNNPNRFLMNSLYTGQSSAWWYDAKQYYYNDYLTQKTETTYLPTGNLVTTENFVYNPAPSYNSTIMSNQDVLFKKNIVSSSNNEIIETQYKYPWDTYLLSSADFLNFKNANITTPLGEIQSRNNIKLSENFTSYVKDVTTNNRLLPKFIYSGKFPNSNTTVPIIGQLEKNITFDLYDDKSNLIQFTKENGSTTAII